MMFPTMYVPPALFGLTEASSLIAAAAINMTPVVIALAIGALVIAAAHWLHARQEATPLTRRPRLQSIRHAPVTATA